MLSSGNSRCRRAISRSSVRSGAGVWRSPPSGSRSSAIAPATAAMLPVISPPTPQCSQPSSSCTSVVPVCWLKRAAAMSAKRCSRVAQSVASEARLALATAAGSASQPGSS